MNQARGFTLMEVMLAVGILAVMSLLTFEASRGLLNAKAKATRGSEHLHAVRVTLMKLAADLNQAFLVSPVFQGAGPGYLTAFVGQEASLAFTTMGHFRTVEDVAETEQAKVGYELKNDAEEVWQTLVRRESSPLDDKPEAGEGFIPLVAGVKALQLEYYNQKSEEWIQEWDSTKIKNLNQLPRAVKIALTVVDEQGVASTYATIVAIALYEKMVEF